MIDNEELQEILGKLKEAMPYIHEKDKADGELMPCNGHIVLSDEFEYVLKDDWYVLDKDGVLSGPNTRADADNRASRWDEAFPVVAPHRVVRIQVIEDE